MSNGIGRKRTLGIAVEATYGVAATAATFVLPLMDTPRLEPVQMKERNVASLGSSYISDSVENTNRMANFSLNIKVDEDHLPIFFLQQFDISSTTASGQTNAYQHTLTYSDTNAGTSFTLFLDDGDRTSVIVAGAKFDSLNAVLEATFVRLEADGKGIYPVTWTGSNTVTQPNDFVGRNAKFYEADYGSSLAEYKLLSANLNHAFNLSSDDMNFSLGDGDMDNLFTGASDFTLEVSALFPNFDLRNDYENNTKKKWMFTIEDTARFVTASQSPSITFSYPVGFIEEWSEDGGLDDNLQQSLTLHPVDEVGVSGAPASITIINSIASY